MNKKSISTTKYLVLTLIACLFSRQVYAESANQSTLQSKGKASIQSDAAVPLFGNYDHLSEDQRAEKIAEFQKSYSESWSKPTVFDYDYVVFQGKVFENAYYRSQTSASYGSQQVSEKPAHLIGRTAPYWELKDGVWKMKRKASSLLRQMIFGDKKEVKLYRGASVQEAVAWQLLKNWSQSIDYVKKEEMEELDKMISESFPASFVTAWRSDLKPKILANSITAKEVSAQLLPLWKNELNVYFTSTSAEAAYYFGIDRWQGEDRKNGRVIEFTIKVEDLGRQEIEPYVGFEDGYVEVGFSTDPSLPLLLNSLTRTDIDDSNFSQTFGK